MRHLITVVLLAGSAGIAVPQTCTFSVIGLNRARRVMNNVHVECPGSIHTAPFGNWGVTSAYGRKQNAHQFDGWCRDRVVCDNFGNCKTDCRDGWYEWNSCTDIPQFQAPNCYLYNSAGCTEQVSATDVNQLGAVRLNLRTACPFDSNGDGFCDTGGCLDIRSITTQNNFLSLYELDPWATDALVQTVYFGPTSVYPSCDAWGCAPSGSAWVTPTLYDSPSWPPKADAAVAMWQNGGSFSDSSGTCSWYAQFDRRYRCY